jgi:hypothetical protein
MPQNLTSAFFIDQHLNRNQFHKHFTAVIYRRSHKNYIVNLVEWWEGALRLGARQVAARHYVLSV